MKNFTNNKIRYHKINNIFIGKIHTYSMTAVQTAKVCISCSILRVHAGLHKTISWVQSFGGGSVLVIAVKGIKQDYLLRTNMNKFHKNTK